MPRMPAASPSPVPPSAPTAATATTRVDAPPSASVPLAPPDAPALGVGALAVTAGDGHEGHAAIAVGPGRPGYGRLGRSPGILDVSGLPIHGAKIHRPLLPPDTLSRERLNGWLDIHAAGRIVLIVAEAGFGKTTLLADWSRRTDRRCLWYRLERDDRDWLGFVRHVVGSGRETDDEFMPRTLRLLNDMGPGGPTRDTVVESFLTELAAEAAAEPHGITLILDDYHAVDGDDEVVPVVRGLLERAGDGLTVIISTRSNPALPLGRFRARGGVARLEGEELCFALDETERLFRDAYQRPLEPDVVEDLVHRTDGWPAALRLVRSAIEERTQHETRAFIRELSGARGELHDFLAEEVVGSLAPELQHFLMRTAILDAVDPRAVVVVDPPSAAHLPERVARAEALGLLGRPDHESPHRFHPLVRDFLQARLVSEIGPDRLREMHLEVGRHFEGVDWRISATHYSRGGDQPSVDRVVDGAVDQILAEGCFAEAEAFVADDHYGNARVIALILRSRAEIGRGDIETATELARLAVDRAKASGDGRVGLTLLNLATLLALGGPQQAAVDTATEALAFTLTPSQRDVAQALLALWDAAHAGDLGLIGRVLRRLAERQTEARQFHYAAVTRLNLSLVLFWKGDANEALRAANDAEALFLSSSGSAELAAVAAARARALAHLGRMDDARATLEAAAHDDNEIRRYEVLVEGALTHCMYGDLSEAEAWLDGAGPPDNHRSILLGPWAMAAAEIAVRKGDLEAATTHVAELSAHGLGADAATLLRTEILRARIALRCGQDAAEHLSRAMALAEQQRSRLGRSMTMLLRAVASSGPIGGAVTGLRPSDLPVLSLLAEELSTRLHRLTPEALATVSGQVALRPARWRGSLLESAIGGGPSAQDAAKLLIQAGTRQELEQLRSAATQHRHLRESAAALARQIAPQIQIHDLGPVALTIGHQQLPGHRIRRRVLALLCFLVSRPTMAASRDEVLDQLWPDLSPETSVNSLNQTIYFLRRVIELDYREGFSAGYVRFDGETVSLDPSLVSCTSYQCRDLVAQARRGDRGAVRALAAMYVGRFALDFAYEEWATAYRENLHAAVLGVLERAIDDLRARGELDEAVELAQRALELEPGSDEFELTLLRLYRATGQHAAAAEQYAHYSTTLREELGVEPPALESL